MHPDTHLTEETLGATLDEALAPAALAAAREHLARCSACAARVVELERLYHALAALPELPLERDLAPVVVARLQSAPRAPARAWPAGALRLVVAAQAGLALVFLAGAWELALAAFFPQAEPGWLSLPLAQLADLGAALWANGAQALQAGLQNPLPALPGLAAPPAWLGGPLAALALLWLAGNGLLLRPPRARRKFSADGVEHG